MTSKKILFTGGNGFIGRQIIPLIEGAGYDVVRPRSTQVRLEVDEEVATLFSDGQHYDAIIHGAIVGGRRDVDDDWGVMHTNLNMFETLYKYIDHTDMFINLDSGASYGRPAPVPEPSPQDFGQVIPGDPYGFSKYIIAKRVLADPKIDTHGPILAIFSHPSTNSDITLKICQESDIFISFQLFFLNALNFLGGFCHTVLSFDNF